MALYTPGSEPDNIKKRINDLLEKLDKVYPDKVVIALYNDHKRLGETVTELYRLLGYSNGNEFLAAYGYKYEKKNSDSVGRPKSTNAKEIIEALQKKYPNGSPYYTAEELFKANPEYASKYKTVANNSKQVFGMGLSTYLRSIKLLSWPPAAYQKKSSDKEKTNDIKKQNKAETKKTANKPTKKKSAESNEFDDIILSEDGKIVTGSKKASTGERVNVYIPSGVVTIEDNALARVNIAKLYIPKELKHLGKYTLYDVYDKAKNITAIEIEEGNENFISDGVGLYQVISGKKKLLYFTDKKLTTYIVPEDVTSFESAAFANASMLEKIILSEGIESFDENMLPVTTHVKEVFLPKTVKILKVKNRAEEVYIGNNIFYSIDEDSEYFFCDEDSIYEILEDGTYKLIVCLYSGKGKVLFLDGTSIIGANAFAGYKNVKNVVFPQSLKVIEENAFSETGIKSLVVPRSVKTIGHGAFKSCENLSSVQIHSDIEHIESDIFDGCTKLKGIKSEGQKNAFLFKNGKIRKKYLGQKTDSESKIEFRSWIEGKIFVHTGLSIDDESRFIEIVTSNGGEVRGSTVLSTDYLVYNPDYDHETTKLRRARELNKNGKDIKIITYDEWNNMIGKEDAVSEYIEPVSSEILKASDRDYFDEFAKEMVKIISEESVSYKTRINDRVTYDEDKRIISVKAVINQRTESSKLANARVATVESLKENEQVRIVFKNEQWEIVTVDGEPIGELSNTLAKMRVPYINYIKVDKCIVVNILPKSKRGGKAKYATGFVKFDIIERQIVSSSPENDVEIRKQFVYTVDEKEAHLIKWIGDASVKSIVIPSAIEDKPVMTINSGVFEVTTWEKPKFEELVISDGIKRLETGALFNTPVFEKIIFPDTVEYISPYVFASEYIVDKDMYLNTNTIYVAAKGTYAYEFLTTYKVNRIGVIKLAVVEDNSEEKISAAKTLLSMEIAVSEGYTVARFSDMLSSYNEKYAVIPGTIKGRPVDTFDIGSVPNCIKTLVIPAYITKLYNIDARLLFYTHGHGLENIEIDKDNPVYCSDGKSIFSKDRKTLIRFVSYVTKEYSIPEGTEIISKYAFSQMENIEKLTIPKSIKKIGDHAFYECKKLIDIVGLENATEIGEKIFSGEGFFGGTIPFEEKSSVLIIGNTIKRYNDLSKRVIQVPDGITKISESAFGWKNDNDVVEEIILPSSVQIIERAAFNGRKKLTKVNIPEGVKEIYGATFGGCSNLQRIYIPASVEKIDVGAFPVYHQATRSRPEETCSLVAIDVSPDNKYYCSVNGMLLSKDKSELLFIPNSIESDKVIIPKEVKVIGAYCARSNMALKELIIPENVTQIGEYAFYECINLEKVIFTNGLNSIGKYGFSKCKNLEKVVFTSELKSIGVGAFSKCSKLNNVTLPKEIQTIEESVFLDCISLSTIELPETIKHIGSKAFANTAIEKVTVPKSVKTLGWGAFSCVPVIEVYDSIDPDAKDADKAIDMVNGNPNSLVGYIGMGPAWAMWECAANHRWVNYTIVVRSSDTNEIKYKVWMGADASQREYYCFLSSAWGHNATFAFGTLDEYFSKIRGKDNKVQVAKYRLEYPYELSDENRVKYESYLEKYL